MRKLGAGPGPCSGDWHSAPKLFISSMSLHVAKQMKASGLHDLPIGCYRHNLGLRMDVLIIIYMLPTGISIWMPHPHNRAEQGWYTHIIDCTEAARSINKLYADHNVNAAKKRARK